MRNKCAFFVASFVPSCRRKHDANERHVQVVSAVDWCDGVVRDFNHFLPPPTLRTLGNVSRQKTV